jgi:hypothetical protein
MNTGANYLEREALFIQKAMNLVLNELSRLHKEELALRSIIK